MDFKLAKDIKVGDITEPLAIAVTEVVPIAVTDGVDEPHKFVLFFADGTALVFSPNDKIYIRTMGQYGFNTGKDW